MKDGATTDSYRMFALLSTLCQSPITWYTSGPTQKFILRQIRSIDTEQMSASSLQPGAEDQANTINISNTQLDVCLLMLYGHILFTSTSYTYALGKLRIGTCLSCTANERFGQVTSCEREYSIPETQW